MAKNQIRIFFLKNIQKAQKSTLKARFCEGTRFRGKKPQGLCALRLSALLTTLHHSVMKRPLLHKFSAVKTLPNAIHQVKKATLKGAQVFQILFQGYSPSSQNLIETMYLKTLCRVRAPHQSIKLSMPPFLMFVL